MPHAPTESGAHDDDGTPTPPRKRSNRESVCVVYPCDVCIMPPSTCGHGAGERSARRARSPSGRASGHNVSVAAAVPVAAALTSSAGSGVDIGDTVRVSACVWQRCDVDRVRARAPGHAHVIQVSQEQVRARTVLRRVTHLRYMIAVSELDRHEQIGSGAFG
jgi:hypothetical protein